MMKTILKALVAWCLLFIITHPKTNAQELLSIDDAILTGLENNYGIQILRNVAEQAGNNYSYGLYNFFPGVSLSSSRSGQVSDSEFIAGGEARSTSGARSNNMNAAINLDWTLFDGFRMFAAYDQVAKLRDLSDNELRLNMELLVANISFAYYNIIRITEQLKILENNFEVSLERIEIEETKYDLGSGSEYDLLQARTDLNADRAAYIRERNRLNEAKIYLNELLSRPPNTGFDVTDEIQIRRNLVREELYQKIVTENTELAIARMQKDIAGLEVRQIRGERYPEISLTSGYSFNRSENDGGFIRFNETTGFSIGISARVSLFDGANITRRIQNARINQRNASLSLEMQKLRLESDFEAVYRAYLNAVELVDLEEENFINAEQTLDIALERFRLGSISSLEFREAQRTFLQAENRLINAKYDAKIAETELLQLSGDLAMLFIN
jgi:outer membrane protein